MPLKQKILCEIRNKMTAKIRCKIADHVVYQSQFVKAWWERISGEVTVPTSIIYNAVNLDEFKPISNMSPSKIICVEGNIDYSPYSLDVLDFISTELIGSEFDSLDIYGGFEDTSLIDKFPSLSFKGPVSREDIPKVYNNGIYFSLDVNAACPNTVIEALASGIPVTGFDTGALAELLKENSGVAAAYGNDPWGLSPPKSSNLINSFLEIKSNYKSFSQNARKCAEKHYSLDGMINKYMALFA